MSNISQPQLVTLKRLMGLLAVFVCAKLLQSCPTLCDPRDGSPPGSPVPAILQATFQSEVFRILSKVQHSHQSKCKTFLMDSGKSEDPRTCRNGLFGSQAQNIYFKINLLTNVKVSM